MAVSIHTVKQREKLAPRREPYWQRLAAGQHLGFRKLESGPGTWIAKFRDEATGKRNLQALGDFADHPDANRYDAAALAAADWFGHLNVGGSTGKSTIADICAMYVQRLRDDGNASAAADAERRFKQYVLDDPKLAATECSKLKAVQISAWRTRIESRPTPKGTKRTPSSLNREITPFRAALNHAHDTKIFTTDAAWSITLRPIKGADKRRTEYPTKAEIKRIIEAADSELAALLTALALVPVRPGAMAALVVADFNKNRSELTIPTDKAGEHRTIKLPASTADHFAKHCASKHPSAPIFSKDGAAWDKDRWKTPFKVAAIKAGVQIVSKEPTPIDPAKRMDKQRETMRGSTLTTKVTLYGFRHSVVTALIEAGLPLQTIAQIAGTSLRMIHANYGHLTDRSSVAALETLAL